MRGFGWGEVKNIYAYDMPMSESLFVMAVIINYLIIIKLDWVALGHCAASVSLAALGLWAINHMTLKLARNSASADFGWLFHLNFLPACYPCVAELDGNVTFRASQNLEANPFVEFNKASAPHLIVPRRIVLSESKSDLFCSHMTVGTKIATTPRCKRIILGHPFWSECCPRWHS